MRTGLRATFEHCSIRESRGLGAATAPARIPGLRVVGRTLGADPYWRPAMTTIETHLQSLHNNATPETTTGIGAKSVSRKAATVQKLMVRPRGATMVEMMAATAWQNHSVRAFLSGLRKKGRTVVKESRKTGEVAYRLVVAPAAPVEVSINGETK